MKSNLKLFTIFFLISISQTLTTDPSTTVFDLDDLLTGECLFSSQTLGSFISDGSHITTFLNINSSNILK